MFETILVIVIWSLLIATLFILNVLGAFFFVSEMIPLLWSKYSSWEKDLLLLLFLVLFYFDGHIFARLLTEDHSWAVLSLNTALSTFVVELIFLSLLGLVKLFHGIIKRMVAKEEYIQSVSDRAAEMSNEVLLKAYQEARMKKDTNIMFKLDFEVFCKEIQKRKLGIKAIKMAVESEEEREIAE